MPGKSNFKVSKKCVNLPLREMLFWWISLNSIWLTETCSLFKLDIYVKCYNTRGMSCFNSIPGIFSSVFLEDSESWTYCTSLGPLPSLLVGIHPPPRSWLYIYCLSKGLLLTSKFWPHFLGNLPCSLPAVAPSIKSSIFCVSIQSIRLLSPVMLISFQLF